MLETIEQAIAIKEELKRELPYMEGACKLLIDSIRRGNKILFCGNGGSAADAQHIVAELVHKLTRRRKSLPAIALTTNTSLLTAIANDDSYDLIFSRQIEGIGRSGDILIAISTSGNSPNLLKAVSMAKFIDMKTVCLCGSGGRLKEIVDIAIKVPSTDTQRIQECHILIGHIITEVIEDAFA